MYYVGMIEKIELINRLLAADYIADAELVGPRCYELIPHYSTRDIMELTTDGAGYKLTRIDRATYRRVENTYSAQTAARLILHWSLALNGSALYRDFDKDLIPDLKALLKTRGISVHDLDLELIGFHFAYPRVGKRISHGFMLHLPENNEDLINVVELARHAN